MKKILILIVFFILTNCSTKKPAPRTLSVMTFNVENLFDLNHDKGKDDFTFLPMKLKKSIYKKDWLKSCNATKNLVWRKQCLELDWNEEKYFEKLRRLATVIRESTAGCPDIVIMPEVENELVLKKLNGELIGCGYGSTAISDNRDNRGIDIAVLSKLPIISYSTNDIPFSSIASISKKDTRGILDVNLNVGGTPLRLLGLHLPAPNHPMVQREDAVKFLSALYADRQNSLTIIAGDWNIISGEDEKIAALKTLRSNFNFSDEIIRLSSIDQGTFYFPPVKNWSFLDKIAFNRGAFDQVTCRVVKILPGQMDKESRPVSFSEDYTQKKGQPGVSDHFPVLCKASY